MSKSFSVLIVDDEPVARKGLRRIVEKYPLTRVVGEARSGKEAISQIQEMNPDVVLLDIEMPEKNGLEVVQEIGAAAMPLVVFVTAFDQYAVTAFDVHAIDYVLKPIRKDRVHEALNRVSEKLNESASISGQLSDALEMIQDLSKAKENEQDRLVIRDGSTIRLINLTDITWVESAGNYVQIHSEGARFLYRATMTSMEERLRQYGFFRTSRSTLVNVKFVKECRYKKRGGFTIHLLNGDILPTSKAYRVNIEQMLSRSA